MINNETNMMYKNAENRKHWPLIQPVLSILPTITDES